MLDTTAYQIRERKSMIKSYAAVLLLMATSAHKTDKNNKLEDNDGSTRY